LQPAPSDIECEAAAANLIDPIQIEANFLPHHDDMEMAVACVEMCREIGNSASRKQFAKRQVMPDILKDTEFNNFSRDRRLRVQPPRPPAAVHRDRTHCVDWGGCSWRKQRL
jgi:choline dehydrogenase